MARKPKPAASQPANAAGKSATNQSATAAPRRDGVRETIESIAIAFILAFLFRTFEAEAFVIPTGSMAPTLMGMHKDVTCPECGIEYKVSASSEGDDDRARILADSHFDHRLGRKSRPEDLEVVEATCPNCRHTMNVDKYNEQGQPTFKGDRLLVAKFPYDFSEPDRWDVVVFKFPVESNQNYIKRLVGLPGETIVIRRGNIYVEDAEHRREIARKPADKIEAIMQTVYDNDYPLKDRTTIGWPERWQPTPASAAEWTQSEDGRSFTVAANGAEPAWLEYRHFVPSQQDWQKKTGGQPPLALDDTGLRPQLITDFYAYNNGVSRAPPERVREPGLNWVGDLIVDVEATVESEAGKLILRLVKGGRWFDSTIDIATGEARLSVSDAPKFSARAETAVRGPGVYKLRFANVDDQLVLWVDGAAVPFDGPTTYDEAETVVPTSEDLAPVRVGVEGATVRFDHLKISRDVYYLAVDRSTGTRGMSEYTERVFGGDGEKAVADLMSSPSRFPDLARTREVKFELGEDEFFMLGDNSPQSSDSRLWPNQHFVERDMLIGKALFIYWPHSWNSPFPFFPNFARMGFVR